MKRALAAVSAIALAVIGLSGCGGTESKESKTEVAVTARQRKRPRRKGAQRNRLLRKPVWNWRRQCLMPRER